MTIKTPTATNLPKPVLAADLKYPSWKSKVRLEKTLTLYEVVDRRDVKEWFIANLLIGKSNRGYAARTYATRVSDGKAGFRVGKGPHVTQTVTVYVTTANATRLAPLLAMAEAGEVTAHQIRDRISTRRAQGQMYRAEGRSSWRW